MTSVPISAVRTDGGTQSRVGLNEATVAEYVAALENGDVFPPITVFYDGENYWPGDGFHRHEAHRQAGRDTIKADVRAGTQRDALLFSLTANSKHGLPRTNADKNKAVRTALADPEWSELSCREIAKLCAVSHDFAARVKRELSSDYRRALRPETGGQPPSRVAEECHPMTGDDLDAEVAALLDRIRPHIASASRGAKIEVRRFVDMQIELHGASI